MPGGVTGYAAINARVRVMYSTLLSQEEMITLCEATDFDSLIALLKHTVYAPTLEKVKDKDLTARRAAFQIRIRLAEAYSSIIHSSPLHARGLLTQSYRYFEVDNLKAVLRGVVTGASWDRVRYVLFPMGDSTVLAAQEMVETGSVAAAVELLRGTPYYETLSFAMKRYSVEQSLFPIEVALDLHYWRELWKYVNQLPGDDRSEALKIVGSQVDMNNLMWAIRYRVYHHISEEELINYTLPFGYHVRDEDIRGIAAGSDISQIVKRVYPNIPDVDLMLHDPHAGLPQLERALNLNLADRCRSAFMGNPFHIGVSLAYLFLTQLEIRDLTVLFEAKSAQTPLEDYQPFLLSGCGKN
jgi:V/A-type H+/Na+-transporting ATPase subunit C